jgi:cytochrome c
MTPSSGASILAGRRQIVRTLAALGLLWAAPAASADAAGDAKTGARAFRACAACHSLQPGRHMTGPSLAGMWDRTAGAAPDFTRYSPALRSSGITWNERTLDAWLADPKALVPGNTMIFPGLEDAKTRADLIAFLKAADQGGPAGQAPAGGMQGGMMGAPRLTDLKTVGPERQVTAIRYCGDSYRVTTAAGELPPFWEFNLRFKTDSGKTGPVKGRPAIMPAGMMGDRASVIFSDPAEISAFIQKRC